MFIKSNPSKLFLSKNNFISIIINSYEYFFDTKVTLYQALLEKSWYIPRFCYHSKLLLAGNCRMCFVEILGIGKPSISCSTIITNNMKVNTNSFLAYKSRENILEFILINHPIDCPVCDKGGECDLQDQYVVMGSLASRFYEYNKKSIKNKNVSFLIKLSLNKCINCTRCTRFSQNVTGEYSFSLLGRGENSVISNYINYKYTGEIIGNILDLCPVGASTSKIISYDFRLWELFDVKYVDFTDIIQPPIRIDYRGLKIIRILPITNELIQEEWISDKIRYNFKCFFKNRYYKPFLKKKFYFINISWKNSNLFLKNKYINLLNFFLKKLNFIIKNTTLCKQTTDIYIFMYFKKYFKKLNFLESLNIKTNNKKFYFRNTYMINNSDLDYLDVEGFIFLNFNIRYELPLLNFKIREKINFDYSSVSVFGSILELNYAYNFLGCNIKSFIYLFRNSFTKIEKNVLFFSENKKNFIINKIINCLKITKFNVSLLNNFSLLCSELNFGKLSNISLFNKFFCINYENNLNYNLSFIKLNNALNINLSQNIFNLKNYNVLIPKKFSFEQNSLFINVFGEYNDFTYMLYKIDLKSLKNDWNILEHFLSVLNNKTNNLKLSFIRKIFMPLKLKLSVYKLNIFFFVLTNTNIFLINDSKNYYFLKNNNFYFDVFSKNNSLFSYLKKMNRKNLFANYININSIHWLF